MLGLPGDSQAALTMYQGIRSLHSPFPKLTHTREDEEASAWRAERGTRLTECLRCSQTRVTACIVSQQKRPKERVRGNDAPEGLGQVWLAEAPLHTRLCHLQDQPTRQDLIAHVFLQPHLRKGKKNPIRSVLKMLYSMANKYEGT